MAAAWSSFLQDVLPHVDECPTVIVTHELKRAAQRFFQGSRAWQITVPPVPVPALTESVTISVSNSELDLVRVEKAWYDGKPLDVFTAEEMDSSYSDDWQTHTSSAPFAVVQVTPGAVQLYPIPTDAAVSGIKFRVSVMPSDVATGIPDDMAAKFFDAVVVGAKAGLMIYPNKPWSNFDLGGVAGTAFDAMISNARLDATRSYGRGRVPSRPRWC